MRAGRNPTRRSRNIGTAKQGHGQNNALVIPVRIHPSLTFYYENLRNCQSVTRDFAHRSLTFLVEETRAACFHACTVDDIAQLLQFVPAEDWADIDFIALRQPKRKEEILKAAWGRWQPYVEIGSHCGTAIFLDSLDNARSLRWTKSLMPGFEKELAQLREYGHDVTESQRHYLISSSWESIRHTQLYRTLLHEIGHNVDSKRNPDAFKTKSSADKEAFAHRYAITLNQNLRKQNIIPFERKFSPQSIKADQLRISDFEINKS